MVNLPLNLSGFFMAFKANIAPVGLTYYSKIDRINKLNL